MQKRVGVLNISPRRLVQFFGLRVAAALTTCVGERLQADRVLPIRKLAGTCRNPHGKNTL